MSCNPIIKNTAQVLKSGQLDIIYNPYAYTIRLLGYGEAEKTRLGFQEYLLKRSKVYIHDPCATLLIDALITRTKNQKKLFDKTGK